MDSGCRAGERAPGRYRPRRPSESVLYRCVQEHLETWLAQCRDRHDAAGAVPASVEREFRRYLECGVLAHGFARARCGQCGHDFLVAFSCKRCGFCPSCGARRMAEAAALLVDEVLPERPLRQWVLSLPYALRFLQATNPAALTRVLGVVYRTISDFLLRRAGLTRSRGDTGAVTLVQRFGSALNLNISTLNAHLHFHCAVIDGVFDSAAGGVVFHAATGLDATAITQVQAQVRRWLLRGFVRRGLLPGDDAQAMAQWEHGGGFSVDGSVRIAAADRIVSAAGNDVVLPKGLAPATLGTVTVAGDKVRLALAAGQKMHTVEDGKPPFEFAEREMVAGERRLEWVTAGRLSLQFVRRDDGRCVPAAAATRCELPDARKTTRIQRSRGPGSDF